MNKSIIGVLIMLAFLPMDLASAQKKGKLWTDWSKKDAERVLNDSPWARTQTDTSSSQKLYTRVADPNLSPDRSTQVTTARLGRGAVDKEVNVRFHVRFFSARPVRQALARLMELEQKPTGEVLTKLHGFAEAKPVSTIVVTASFDSNEPAYLGTVMQAFDTGTTGILKNNTYLERSDGKRVYLEQYVPPGKDGFGARFVFPRKIDGAPFLNAESGEVRFHAEYPVGILIERRFKVAGMVYNGEIEY